jgi:hypothetical protein
MVIFPFWARADIELWPLLTVYAAPFEDLYRLLEYSSETDGEGDPDEVVDVEQRIEHGDTARNCDQRAAHQHVCGSGEAVGLRTMYRLPLR